VRFHETVEIHGHLMDTGVLANVLDDVLNYGGDYKIERIDLGHTHDDESHATIVVGADDATRLERILMRIQIHGMNRVEPGEAILCGADRDGVFPEDFYSSTNLETVVRLGGAWVPVEHPEMDCGLVVRGGRVRTVPVSDVRAGDMIVCGARGVKVVPPVTEHSIRAENTFEFGASTLVSRDTSQALVVRQLARQIREVKAEGASVLWVAGSAVVRTGAAPAMVALVEAGFVDVLFAGNELATRDIEASLFGTSLSTSGGRDLVRGRGVAHEHEHHIRAINTIRRAGSISAAVEQGVLTSGVMHAMVKANKKAVLVGSVRDDGPLPDAYTDVVEGQRAMRSALRGVGFTLMIATLLHSIATGNILPASIPLACIDINPSTVARLSDRPTGQAIGIVTDIGLFLEQLAYELVPDYRGSAD
jgi:lysine-ketoglutarate reductase/saccharopine dehydrogenase-like protein (TIGR00300 family)